MKRALHKVAHENCPHPNWAACDKAGAEEYARWGAMQQVILAYNIVAKGRSSAFKREKGTFAQLVQYIAGDRDGIVDSKGNPSVTKDSQLLMEAVERVIHGDLPAYNLYRPQVVAGSQEA